MLSLAPLLRGYARKPATIRGGADELQPVTNEPAAAAPFNKEQFRADLGRLTRINTVSIAVVATLIVIAFALTLLIIRQYATNATAVASLFVGFGTLTAGLTTAILGLFKIKAQSDMLRILSKNLDSASLQTIIDVLAKRT